MKDIAQVEKKSLTNAERQRAYRQRKKCYIWIKRWWCKALIRIYLHIQIYTLLHL